jgi:hypothetical protein
MDLVTEATSLVRTAAEQGATVRMLGGVAVALRCPTALAPTFAREYGDLDAVILRRDQKRLDHTLAAASFEPDEAFNAQWGKERRCYHRADGLKLDVFVESFTMCHTIPFVSDRLLTEKQTVPLAELLLTKAQIVEMNDKDARDLFVLVHDHTLTADDTGINVTRVSELCSADWGLWRTVTGTLQTMIDAPGPEDADLDARAVVRGRLSELLEELKRVPKSRKWKLRNTVGDRVQWYVLPEEPNEAIDLHAMNEDPAGVAGEKA